MISAKNFQSFCIEPRERWLFAGNISGQIASVEIDRFAIAAETQAHAGGIHGMACHRTLPYIAAVSTDRSVSVWRYDETSGRLSPVASRSFRELACENDHDPVPYLQSTSQAIAFHDRDHRLLTRTGSGGLLELEFDDRELRVVRCVRLSGEEDLVQVRYLANSDLVLAMANFGTVVVARDGVPLRSWKFGHHNVHWAEHIEGDMYLLASDTLRLIRLDASGAQEPFEGERITRDDLEHVSINRTSGRAFAGSFDGSIYEVDPATCRVIDVVYRAPFKCRWVRSLERAPPTQLIQCRNGSLHEIDLDTGERIAMIRETPDALWSADVLANGDLVIGGDADAFFRLHLESIDRRSRVPMFSVRRLPVPVTTEVHTKRVATHRPSERTVLGRIDGDLWVNRGAEFMRLAQLGSPIRDVATHPVLPIAFAGTEDGKVRRLDLDSGSIQQTFTSPRNEPIWAVAYQPEENLLAFAERQGSLYVVDATTFEPVREIRDLRRCKRMKWADPHTLFYGRSTELYRLDLVTGHHTLHVQETGNSIEDFIWDARRRYLVLINYNSLIILCDYETGHFIDVTPDQMDYTKGMVWIDPAMRPELDLYPLDFLTFGRCGTPYLYRIHDEKCIPLGPLPGAAWNEKWKTR